VSRIAKSTVLAVQERMDAIAVIENYIRVEKRGGRYWGKCPFHSGGQEKTPSLKIDPDQKLYYCFACKKGGGIIDFVMEMDKITYPEAIGNLARKFGIEIAYEGDNDESAKDREKENTRKSELLELYRRTAVTFSHFLLSKNEGKQALAYLEDRKISREMIECFKLGYSPVDRYWLYNFLQGKSYEADFLDSSGLFSSNHRGMAFFSGRLMFPICDRQGRVVAFGGRTLPGAKQSDGSEPPKYINTREIDIYKKGQVFFGLDLALPEIRRRKKVYLAEGYMDVIALHQAGVTNAIASCGTAFTDEQAKLLRNWADTVILVFDTDEAGQKAAEKGILICRKNGLSCSVVVQNKSESDAGMKDPAEILQKFGEETLKNSVESTIFDFDHLIARGKTLYDITIPQGKSNALSLLYPYLDVLESKTELNACIEHAADIIRTDKGALQKDFEHWQHSVRRAAAKTKTEEGPETPETIRMTDELFLLTVIVFNAILYPEFRNSVEIREIEDPAAKELFVTLEECYTNEELGLDYVLSRLNSENLRNFIIEQGIRKEFRSDSKINPGILMEDGIKRLRGKKLRRRLLEIAAELRLMEKNSGMEADSGYQELIKEKMNLDAEIHQMEGK